MLNLEQIKDIAKCIDEIDLLLDNLEKNYNNKDATEFNNTKKKILEDHDKISSLIQ